MLTILMTWQMFKVTQTSFLPDEDQRVVFVSMEMPEGTTMKRSREVSMRATEMLLALTNEVNSVMSINGFSMVGGRGEN